MTTGDQHLTDSRCNYVTYAGRACNKCGRHHDGGGSPWPGIIDTDQLDEPPTPAGSPSLYPDPPIGTVCEPEVICEPVPEGEDGFTEWVCPKPVGYLMQCCDCGLIHEAEFRVAKYEPRPSEEFVVVGDLDLQAQFRMRRHGDHK